MVDGLAFEGLAGSVSVVGKEDSFLYVLLKTVIGLFKNRKCQDSQGAQ